MRQIYRIAGDAAYQAGPVAPLGNQTSMSSGEGVWRETTRMDQTKLPSS
jgi:hypothetical protein